MAAEPLLGLNSCQVLGLIKRLCTTKAPENCDVSKATENSVARDNINIFTGIGHMERYPYTIQVKEDSTPYAASARVGCRILISTKLKQSCSGWASLELLKNLQNPQHGLVPVPKKNLSPSESLWT